MSTQRIAVIGCPGSGKTTFCNTLGQALQRDVVHLDKVLWAPNWQMISYNERKQIHDKLIAEESWLIDGMWRSHLSDRLQRATLVIFLDYKRSVCMRRATLRHLKNLHKQRPDIAQGCIEKHDRDFSNYIKTFNKKVRPFIVTQLAQTDAKVVVLSNPRQAQKYLNQLTKANCN